MNVKEVILKSESTKEKYEYYKHLGYSEEASCVLALFTYGSAFSGIKAFIETLGDEDILKKFYAHLTDSQDIDSFQQMINKKFVKDATPNLFKALVGFAPQGVVCNSASPASFKVRSAVQRMGQTSVAKASSYSRVQREMAYEESGAVCDSLVEPELIATDSYESIEEKDAKGVFTAPTSTFRMTTNTASVGVVLNQIRSGRRVDMSQVRIEEILNYFDYKSEKPDKELFEINTELLKKSDAKKLLYINVQGKELEKEHKNIILLLDVSGSMSTNAEVTQEAIATVVSKLKPEDVFSLITYSDNDETVFDSFKIKSEDDKEYIMGKVLTLAITGCTYGSAGIETAYKIGAKNYNPDWNNQVILITDGDLNFGITKKDGLQKLIEEKKKENIFLSVIGTGLWNYKDDKLEVLCKHGNGTYCVINSLFDVKESIDKKYASLTNIIAKDVKAQVEFNPKYVKEYRLLGYENRELNHEDFVNDKVISEPYGSGGHGVALYELTCSGDTKEPNLKYQKSEIIDSDELCTVKIRYKEPLSDESKEIEKVVSSKENDNYNLILAYALYVISEKLRQSEKLDEDDEKFINEFIKSEKYKKYMEINGEKLEMFVKNILE